MEFVQNSIQSSDVDSSKIISLIHQASLVNFSIAPLISGTGSCCL